MSVVILFKLLEYPNYLANLDILDEEITIQIKLANAHQISRITS